MTQHERKLHRVHVPGEPRPPYPEGDVIGPCVCGSWPGGPCLQCEWREASAPKDYWLENAHDLGELDTDKYPHRRIIVAILAVFAWLLVFCLGAIFYLLWTTMAGAHQAPSGSWTYPPGCCRSAEEPGGDCAPIDDRYVTSRPDGYHINLPKGAHPKLVNKGYVGVVPYDKTLVSPDMQTHICLSMDGGTRYCFFKNPPGV